MKRDPLQPRPLLTRAEAIGEANRCQGCAEPACRKGCPLDIDVGAFIRRIQTGNWAGALRVMMQSNPLPETCALICPVEVLCEAQCNAAELAYPIRIAELQRAGAHYGRERLRFQPRQPAEPAGKVAVVGGGPAGLACAARLRLDGFEVHMFEKRDALGGALRWWIPPYRLSRDVLQREVDQIVQLGIEVHTHQALGRDFGLDDLRRRFDAVFLGLGLPAGQALQVPGRDGSAVFDALQMLESACEGRLDALPEPVVVIGGGNTAIDAAVTARHLGASEVYLLYRRSFGQMPAWPAERNRAVDLGVHVLILLKPIEYVRDEAGNLVGVRCRRTRLRSAGEQARAEPIDVPDSEFVLQAGCVIEAVGQRPDETIRAALADLAWSEAAALATDPATGRTNLPDVFAGGDLVNGGQTAAQAMAEGIRAAEAIEQFVRGQSGGARL